MRRPKFSPARLLVVRRMPELFGGRKDRRSIVSDPDSNSGSRAEFGKAFNPRKIKTQTGGADLHSQSRFTLRLSAHWAAVGSGIRATIHFSCKAKAAIDSNDAGESIGHHVVLGKQRRRRG